LLLSFWDWESQAAGTSARKSKPEMRLTPTGHLQGIDLRERVEHVKFEQITAALGAGVMEMTKSID
jgi:hypothetical protein